MCDEAVNTYHFVFDFVPVWYKTQEICDRVVSEDPFMIKYLKKFHDALLANTLFW